MAAAYRARDAVRRVLSDQTSRWTRRAGVGVGERVPGLVAAAHDWFAAQVRTGREHVCACHLQMRGYDVFLPCYNERRRWSDRIKTVEKPLFSGYVFCRIGEGVAHKIVTTPGVIRIVGDGHVPLLIACDEIEAIRRVVDARLRAEPSQFLQVGRRVRVEAGPLQGLEGIVLKVKNRHRLVISVSVLLRSVAVEIDPAWVSIPPDWLLRATVAVE